MTVDHQPQDDIMLWIKNSVFQEKGNGTRNWLFGDTYRITAYQRPMGIGMNMTRANHDKMSSSGGSDSEQFFQAMGIEEPPVTRHGKPSDAFYDTRIIETDTKDQAMDKYKKVLNENLDKIGDEVKSAYSGSQSADVSKANILVKTSNKAAWPEIF
jgi:hypothetical protein